MRLFLFLLPFAYLLLLLARFEKSLTQDLGRHIRLGDIILDCFCVPATNLFSFTMPSHPFVNHHWFAEVLFSLLYRISGIELIILFKVVAILISFGIVFWIGRQMGSFFWSVILSFPYIFIFSYRFDARPEIISFLCVSLFLLFIFLYQMRRSIWFLAPLPLLVLIWVNSHIYFFVGLFIYAAFLFSEFLLRRASRGAVVVGFFLLLAVFMSPHGWEGVVLPLRIFEDYGYSIVENQTIFFLNSWFFSYHVFVFELMVVLLGFLAAFSVSRQKIFYYLLFVFSAASSFAMIRNLPLFVLMTYPFAVFVFTKFEDRFLQEKSNVFSFRTLLSLVVGVVVVIQIYLSATSASFGFSYIDTGRGAVSYIQENRLRGPFFNNFDIGSYLIFRLHPEERVFVDGRPEAYTSEFFEEYKRMQTEPEFFELKRLEYGIEMVVFSKTDITPWAQEFLSFLSRSSRWVLVYEDSYYEIHVLRGSDNAIRATVSEDEL